MPEFIQYLLKLFISLTLVYVFYHAVLRKLTFYTWNRWYLLLYSIISFVIPFINIEFLLQKNQWEDIEAFHYIPMLEKYTVVLPGSEAATPVITMWNVVLFILAAGILIMLVRLGIQFFSVWKIRKSATLLHKENPRLYHVGQNIIPFSFGNAIYINPQLHSEEDLKEIIRHEFVHVKQRHSIDILWSELLCIINWYNPVAWMLRKSIRQNLEFIADNNVLQNGLDRKQYQFLLLKVIGVSNFSIANQFNYSSLKKRIAMMNKSKSARLNLVRFLFILPLAAILLLAFRKNHVSDSPSRIQKSYADTLPVGTKTVSLHRDDHMGNDQKSFFEKNPSVVLLHWNIQKGTIEIYKKNGEVEKYDLSINLNEAEKIYGKLPAPVMGSSSTISSSNSDLNKKGYFINIIDVDGHCTVLVKNNNKKVVETVDLLKWNANKNYYENLYGIIPPSSPSSPSNPPSPPTPAIQTTNAVSVTATPQTGQVASVQSNTKQQVIIANNVNVAQTSPVLSTAVSVNPSVNDQNTVQVAQATSVSTSASSNANSAVAVTQRADDGDFEISPVLGPDDFRFEIYKSTTREELNQMISKAKERGAVLTFDEIKYNEKNQLISLSGTFKNKNDKSSFNATDFHKVILSMVQKDGRSHFYIMVTDKVVS